MGGHAIPTGVSDQAGADSTWPSFVGRKPDNDGERRSRTCRSTHLLHLLDHHAVNHALQEHSQSQRTTPAPGSMAHHRILVTFEVALSPEYRQRPLPSMAAPFPTRRSSRTLAAFQVSSRLPGRTKDNAADSDAPVRCRAKMQVLRTNIALM